MLVNLEPKINTKQTRFTKNLIKCTLWPGHYKVLILVLLLTNYLKIGQCLVIDDMTSPSKFGEVTGPNSHL